MRHSSGKLPLLELQPCHEFFSWLFLSYLVFF
jgi:hypothetical protein